MELNLKTLSNMKSIIEYIQESLFDKDLIKKSSYILREITMRYFGILMFSSTVDDWYRHIVELKDYLKKEKVDNITFDQYTNKETYENGIMTIVPLFDDVPKEHSSVIICYKTNNRYYLYEIRCGVVGHKLFPQFYFWTFSIPSERSLPESTFKRIKKSATSHNIYKISFSESDFEEFQDVMSKYKN